MSSFIFIRHGESTANAARALATDDISLTPAGIENVKTASKQLKQFHITKIIASPLPRAQQTAQAIAESLGLDPTAIITLNDLRERSFGTLEGTPKEHESAWYYRLNDQYGTEPQATLIARCKRALTQIKPLADTQQILVVGHATAGFYLLQVAKGHERFADFDEPFQLKNAEFMTVTI